MATRILNSTGRRGTDGRSPGYRSRREACLRGRRRTYGFPDGGLGGVLALVGRVDAPEALAQGQLREALSPVVLPGGPVQEAGDANAVEQHGSVGHRLPPSAGLLVAVGPDHTIIL